MTTEKTTITALQRRAADPGDSLTAPGFETMAGFELLQRQAKMLSQSTLVPTEYRNNLPNAVVALNMAARIGADPIMVMQNLDVIHGRPSWRSQFLIAAFNASGRFKPIKYQMSGTEGQDDWGCRAYTTDSDGDRVDGPLVTIGLAKAEGWYGKGGSKWKTIPELMLRYRAAAWLVRTVAPELTMGINTSEEAVDVIDVTPGDDGVFRVEQLDDVTGNEAPPIDAEPEPAPETDLYIQAMEALATLDSSGSEMVLSGLSIKQFSRKLGDDKLRAVIEEVKRYG